MRAGTLKDRLTLMRWASQGDAVWGQSPGWVEVEDVWANVTPLSGSEREDSQGVQTSISHRVSLRYRADITTKDRLIYRGRTLEIVSAIDVNGAGRELLIEAKEYIENGS